jgi:tetratricopeptide (TPR) repeat protein
MPNRSIIPQDATIVEGSQFEHSFVVKDPEGIQGVLLDARFYNIGRSPKNDIVVRSQLVSRQHATLTGILIDPPLFQLFRLSDGNPEKGRSTNGIQINGERRDHWVLMHGDEIVFSSDSMAYYRIDPEPPYVNGNIDIFIDSLKKLAKLYLKSGNYTDAAEGTLQQILVVTQKFYGEMHPSVANCLTDLAVFNYSKNDFVKAEPLFLQVIDIRKQSLGEEHPDVVSAMLDLAAIYNAQALYAKAESLFLQALEIKKKVLGAEHPEIAASLIDLAAMYYAQKRYPEVKNIYEQAIKIYKRSLDDKHPNVVSVQKKLASIKKKLRPKWLSLNVLIPASLILLSGVIAYTFFAPKTDITCVKILPDGSTKSISGDVCRQISK